MSDVERLVAALHWVSEVTPEMLARVFHTHYEADAVMFGYKTRKASAVAWADVPEANRMLMVNTATHVLRWLIPDSLRAEYGMLILPSGSSPLVPPGAPEP